jgi:hypothetical protein
MHPVSPAVYHTNGDTKRTLRVRINPLIPLFLPPNPHLTHVKIKICNHLNKTLPLRESPYRAIWAQFLPKKKKKITAVLAKQQDSAGM